MNSINYRPEGTSALDEKPSLLQLERAKATNRILEARAVMCDNDHNLIVDLGDIKGVIPREEAAIGIRDGSVKDIAVLSRVNKQICFKVDDILTKQGQTVARLSRVSAQQDALNYMLSTYKKGDIIPARITHLEPFGAFADIGCGIVGLISIENISVSRISHPRDRFFVGQNIRVVIKDIDYENRRFTLSHKERLGTWEENADMFNVGQTVCGVVRSIEDYGIFIELTPNLAGLAEYKAGIVSGQQATVYIKNIIPEKMKIKLSIIDCFCGDAKLEDYRYFCHGSHIDEFVYSPPEANKVIRTSFDEVPV